MQIRSWATKREANRAKTFEGPGQPLLFSAGYSRPALRFQQKVALDIFQGIALGFGCSGPHPPLPGVAHTRLGALGKSCLGPRACCSLNARRVGLKRPPSFRVSFAHAHAHIVCKVRVRVDQRSDLSLALRIIQVYPPVIPAFCYRLVILAHLVLRLFASPASLRAYGGWLCRCVRHGSNDTRIV